MQGLHNGAPRCPKVGPGNHFGQVFCNLLQLILHEFKDVFALGVVFQVEAIGIASTQDLSGFEKFPNSILIELGVLSK